MNGTRSPSPSAGRTLDIELSGQEVIAVDLDNLDANPDDLLEVLRESLSKVWVWTKLATEYWRKGNLDAAEKLARGAEDCMSCYQYCDCLITYQILVFQVYGQKASLPPVYSLLANIQLARARKAPKLVLQDSREFAEHRLGLCVVSSD